MSARGSVQMLAARPTDAAPDGFAETMMLPPAGSRCVLRVLTGDHTGAESEILTDRVLIGNLEHECDIVLDVKSEGRHACLVRVGEDGWTVLAIAGELWLDRAFVAPQQTAPLKPAQVLTLGRVALCLAPPDTVDWAQIQVPQELVKPEAGGPVPQSPLLPSRSAARQRWQALKLAAGLGLGALVLASATVYLSDAWRGRDVGPEVADLRLQADRARVGRLPFAQEVAVLPHPETPRRLLVQGYVPERSDLATLADTLALGSTPADLRVHPVQSLGDELGRRFDGLQRQQVRYQQQGRFELETALAKLPAHDRQARVALQEMPAVGGLALRTVDVLGPDGEPVVVRYERSAERPGDLVVHNLDEALGQRPFTVREVRLGELPSVVLDDGLRYFVDARLRDGSTLAAIDAQRVIVRLPSGAQREIAIGGASVSRSVDRSVRPRN